MEKELKEKYFHTLDCCLVVKEKCVMKRKNFYYMGIIVIFLYVFYFYASSVEVYSVPETGKGQINKEGVKIVEILEAKSEEKFMETDTRRSHEDEYLEEMGDLEEGPVLCYDDELLSELWISTEDLENRPDYSYFEKSGTGYYHLNLIYGVAVSVVHYVQGTELADREWELKRITYVAGQYHAYVESDMQEELFLIFREGKGAGFEYIILADIRQKTEEETGQDRCSIIYSSMLDWYSFGEWYDRDQKGEMDWDGYAMVMDIEGFLLDDMFWNWGCYAVYDYLERQGINPKGNWRMEEERTYISRYWHPADICFTNGNEEIELLIDVYEKTYAVVRGIILDE